MYVELHCHSHFSLLDGASPPEDLAQRAFELGMSALALTDHDAVYGAVRFTKAARACGIRPILGTELTLEDGSHLTLLVENEVGWHNLCALISQARLNAPKGQAALPALALEGHTAGLIALSGCRNGQVSAALLQGDATAAYRAASRLRDLFGPASFWIELQKHRLPEDDWLAFKLTALARRLGVGCVATNNVHYARSAGHALHDVLFCIRHRTTLDESADQRRLNSELYLKSPREMAALFADMPEAITNTCQVAERCRFDLQYGLQDLPHFPTGDLGAEAYLEKLCRTALGERYGEASARVQERLTYELGVIGRAGLANYFLVVHDIVAYSRVNGIRCQGRGSAANSLVAYLLRISPIDPIAHGLVFERFLSDERAVAPDIDVDFSAGNDREKVIQYVYDRYGTDHAAMACTLVTFRARSALREVGKALGFPPALLDGAAKALDTRDPASLTRSASLQEYLGKHGGSLAWQQLLHLCGQLKGFPRHLGIHNGGMIITGPPLAQRVATEPATMPGRVVIQWDKDSLEDAGLIKIDILGLRMLSAIAEALAVIQEGTGAAPDLDRLTFDDPAVYQLITEADTVGVFQVESRAQAQVLPRLRPTKFEDIIVSISLIRPGPIQGQMVHPYLRRRLGKEPVKYFHPSLRPALEETLGIILYQEQVLKVANALSDFTPGQGEQLRRALGSKDGEERVSRFHEAFLKGAQVRGVSKSTAEVVFGKLRAFGSYSFPKSHAAAFAVLVYQSAWLKRYHAAAFYVGLLNNQPMGFWSPAVLVNDAKRHAIRVLPVDLHRSRATCSLENGSIRLGFNYIAYLGVSDAAWLVEIRNEGPFVSLADFCRRTRLARRIIENLILSGALDGWGIGRRELLWELGKLRYERDELALVFGEDKVELPPLTAADKTAAEQGVLGLSVGAHVMSEYRQWLSERQVLSSQDLDACQPGQQVKVAGLLVVHQAPPTAKGHHFLTLEDEREILNVVVRPDVYSRHRRVLRESPLLIVEGTVQRQDGVINLIATRITPLTAMEGQSA